MDKVGVCDMCFDRTDMIRRTDLIGNEEIVSSCCGTGLYLVPETIYDFYKPEINKILAGRNVIFLEGADSRRLEVIEDAWAEYKNTETYYE